MRAKDFPRLDKAKKKPSEKALQQAIDQAHEQALKMNAEFDARVARPAPAETPTAAQRACRKKRPYATADAATQACAVSRSKIKDGYFPVRVYQCDQCSKWHLTSQALRAPTRIRAGESALDRGAVLAQSADALTTAAEQGA